MMKRMKMMALLAGVVMAVAGLGVAQPVLAGICEDYKDDPELYAAAGCDSSVVTADKFANNIITVVLSLVGIIAVIVIVYGGVLYVISIGDSSKLQRAKHVIMYGIIGLVVCLLAYAIVFFISASVGSGS